METLWQDLRYGLRTLAKTRSLAAVAALTLALGIGANVAVFTMVNGLLLRPIPAAHPERLVRFYRVTANGERQRSMSYPDYLGFQEQNGAFSGLLGYSQTPALLNRNGGAEQILAEAVTGNYFSVLGVRSAAGRMFFPEEGRPGQSGTAVISYSFWERRLGSDPNALGSTLLLNDSAYTVIGIAAKGYTGTTAALSIDVWVPLMQAASWLGPDVVTNRERGVLQVIGRLRPGTSLQQAQAAMTIRARQLQQAYPSAQQEKSVQLAPAKFLDHKLRTGIAAFLSLVLALVGLVLLTVCANLANLLLPRAAARHREMAVRLALGASRARLVRQMLTESVLLALVGGVAGLFLGLWISNLLTSFNPLPPSIPLQFDFSIDHRVLLFVLFASLVTGVLLGLAPAMQGTNPDVVPALKEGSGNIGGGRQRSRLRDFFIIAQVAASMVLLAGAGFFLRSLQNVRHIDFGFEAKKALAMDVDLKSKGFTEEKGKQYYSAVLQRVETLPGVRAATLADLAPLDLATPHQVVSIEGQEPPKGQTGIQVSFNVIGTGYFDAFRIPLLSGRDFTVLDASGKPGVAIVNETMAQRYWLGQNPLGKRFRLLGGGNAPLQAKDVEVVGVARNAKYRTLGEDPQPHMYLPFLQNYSPAMTLLVATTDDPARLLGAVQSELQRQNRDVQGFFARTMTQHIGLALLPARLAAALSSVFGALALLLASMGIYGVVASAVQERTREIGLRMALGAQPGDVVRLLLGRISRLIAVGIATGLAGSFVLSRVLAGMLYGVSANDPFTFAAVAAVLCGVALAACYIPARRTMRVDPMVALRYE